MFVGGGATELLKRVTRDCAQVLHDAEVVIQVVACDADAEGEDARLLFSRLDFEWFSSGAKPFWNATG